MRSKTVADGEPRSRRCRREPASANRVEGERVQGNACAVCYTPAMDELHESAFEGDMIEEESGWGGFADDGLGPADAGGVDVGYNRDINIAFEQQQAEYIAQIKALDARIAKLETGQPAEPMT